MHRTPDQDLLPFLGGSGRSQTGMESQRCQNDLLLAHPCCFSSRLHIKTMEHQVSSILTCNDTGGSRFTGGHEGGSYSSTAPFRVYCSEKRCCSGYVRTSHRSPRNNVILHQSLVFVQLRWGCCSTPCGQYVHSWSCYVRLKKKLLLLSSKN